MTASFPLAHRSFTICPTEYLKKGRFVLTDWGKIFLYERNSNEQKTESNKSAKPSGKVLTILFLHGFPTSSYDFLPLMDWLEKSYPNISFRFVAFDFLGLGFSDKPSQFDYPISVEADIMELVIRECKLKDFHIVTHDYGVTVAQEFLARYKECRSSDERSSKSFQLFCDFYNSLQLQKVIFLNGGLFPETHRARLVQKIMASPFAPLVMPFFKRKQFGKSFSAVFGKDTQPSQEELDSLWEIIRYNNGNKMIHRLLSYIRQRRENRERWVSAIVNPPVPIRLVNGNSDPVSGSHMVQRYVDLTGRQDTVNLGKIGHYPQLEAVAEVGKGIADFFFTPLPKNKI